MHVKRRTVLAGRPAAPFLDAVAREAAGEPRARRAAAARAGEREGEDLLLGRLPRCKKEKEGGDVISLPASSEDLLPRLPRRKDNDKKGK